MIRTECQAAFVPHFAFLENSRSDPGSRNESGQVDRAGEKRKTRIIVVDDETLISETVAAILEHEGFEAATASTGLAAIELARNWTPDVVLSDVIMPGLNGIETGMRIREVAPECKIVLFSGQAATVDLLEKAREDGHSFQILAKPIRPEELVALIETLSRRRQ